MNSPNSQSKFVLVTQACFTSGLLLCGSPQLLNSSSLQHTCKPRSNIVNSIYWIDSSGRFKESQRCAYKHSMIQHSSSSELPWVCCPSRVVMLHELDQVIHWHYNNAKYSSCFRYFWSDIRKHGFQVFFNHCFLANISLGWRYVFVSMSKYTVLSCTLAFKIT